MDRFSPYYKALVGAVISGLGALSVAVTDESVTLSEWVGIATATIVALGGVYAIPNRDPQGVHQADSVQPPEGGAIDVGTAIIIAVLVLILLALLGGFR
jgi:hypothetical protein